MRRREFLTLIAALVSPYSAQAQDRLRRIGILVPLAEGDSNATIWLAGFRAELHKTGWVEGRNIRIDTRWGRDAEARQRFAKELVALQPDLIFSVSTASTEALMQQTRTIPIVFVMVTDPVGSGLVASIPRPGGNATGFTAMEQSMAGKWLELLKEIAPNVNRVAILFNPVSATYAEIYLDTFKAAAASFKIEPILAPVRSASDIETAVATQARVPHSGLVVMADPFMAAHRVEVTSMTARYRLPTISPYRFYTELGALLSYGNDVADSYRRAAAYVDRVLNGAKPSELPIQAPVKFELVINLRTARTLGIDVPFQLQQRADAVIE